MSKCKNGLNCQPSSAVTSLAKYQKLMAISTKHKSSALFAGANQAKRLLLKCNQLKREILVIYKQAGFWSKLLLKKKLNRMKAVYDFHLRNLESWLNKFMVHFSVKYEGCY